MSDETMWPDEVRVEPSFRRAGDVSYESPLFCNVWYQAGGCILPRFHKGQHKNLRQHDAEILSARADAAEARVQALEAAGDAVAADRDHWKGVAQHPEAARVARSFHDCETNLDVMQGILEGTRVALQVERERSAALVESGDALAEHAVECTHFSTPDRQNPALAWWECRCCSAPEIVGDPRDLKHESDCALLAWRALRDAQPAPGGGGEGV